MSKKKQRPVLEALEPRVLYSADPFGAVFDLPAIDANDGNTPSLLDSFERQPTPHSDSATPNEEDNSDTPDLSTTPTTPLNDARLELVFVDTGAADYQRLLDDLLSQSDEARNFEVIVIDAQANGINTISNSMAGYRDIDAVHIISHGTSGALKLGSDTLDAQTLKSQADEISQWAEVFSDNGDILLYGCDVASDQSGEAFVEGLSALTGADVAASDDQTGHSDLGGDYEFEYKAGVIESSIALSFAVQDSWISTLDITSNLVSHYEFEENGGSTATDSTTNINDGIWTNAPSWDADSSVGSFALDFTGDASNNNEVVIVADDASLDFSGDFSVAFWYNSSVAQVDGTRIIGSHDGSDGFSIFADSNGSLNFFVEGSTSNFIQSDSAGMVADSNWHHVVATVTSGSLRLYVDNTTSGSGGGTLGTVDPSAPLTIGGENDTTGDYEGKLDDVRIYTRALSASDVGELYALESPPSDLQATVTNGGGLSLNDDGGNDNYLLADDGGAILGELGSLTFEAELSVSEITALSTPLISYSYYDSNTGNTVDDLRLLLRTDGVLGLKLAGSATTLFSGSDYGSTLTDGQSHTLSLTWSSSGVVSIYMDGEFVESKSGMATGQLITSGGTLVIGNEQDSVDGGYDPQQFISGTLNAIRVFSDVRTASEISSSYRSDLPRTESDLVANWRFDRLSADGVITESVSGNNLTVKHINDTGFTASEASLIFTLDENSIAGKIVGQIEGVDAEREAKIASLLAADADLHYNAETGKFYKIVSGSFDQTVAKSAAESTALNSVNGQLVTIRSVNENNFVAGISSGVASVWLGGTDDSNEGEWYWIDSGSETDQFWSGAVAGDNNGAYANWFSSTQPNDAGGAEDAVRLDSSDGKWFDAPTTGSGHSYVVEWNADAVLDATDALTYSIQSQTAAGAFSINASTGQLVVADGSLLDYESNATHTLNVRITDVDSNTYDEAFTVSLNDLVESNNAPTDLSSGIELNTDGGNDAYLKANDGSALLGGLTAFTLETSFSLEDNDNEPGLLSYYVGSDEIRLRFDTADHLRLKINNVNVTTSSAYSELLDGKQHHVAVSWDNSNGDVTFYIDGEFAETITGLAAGHTIAAGGTLAFGNDQDGVDTGYKVDQTLYGTLHDIRIWDEVRSAEEITLNQQLKFDNSALPSGLIANWQMDGFNGSNEVIDVVSGNNLSIDHATGTGFITSTPVDDLHVDENASNGTSIGFVSPHKLDKLTDIVSDGDFTNAAEPVGVIDTYAANGTGSGSALGDWTVTEGGVDLINIANAKSPLGGRVIDLDGNSPGAISQTLTTEIGREYQIVFNLSGDFGSGEEVKNLRVSAGGTSDDFAVAEPPNWSWADTGTFSPQSMTFVADSTSTLLTIKSLEGATSAWGPFIADIRVNEVPAGISTILNNDATLSYDAGTGKFYRHVRDFTDWSSALNAATGSSLNGVAGQLATISSAYENELLRNLSTSGWGTWIGAGDSNVEGDFSWYDGTTAEDELFWSGGQSGSSQNGNYANFDTWQPDNVSNGDAVYLNVFNGKWDDQQIDPSAVNTYFIEWDADEVLSSFNFSLIDDASGRFSIDSNTGEISVADSYRLDFENATSHDVDVQVTDVAGNSYTETMTITVDDGIDNNLNNNPSDLSSGIELNTDGGNDAYLIASDGGAILGGLGALTFETSFSIHEAGQQQLVSYAAGNGNGNDLFVTLGGDGTATINIRGSAISLSGMDYNELMDGQQHSFALTWDSTNGDYRVIVNGDLVDSGTGLATGSTIRGFAGVGELLFGQEQDNIGGAFAISEIFSGTVYDVRIWDEIRSQPEISLNHQNKFDSGSLPSGLIANWQMDGFNGSNQVVDVVSGNNLSIGHANDVTGWTNASTGVSVNGNTITFVDDGAPTGWLSQINSSAMSSFGLTDDYTVNFDVPQLAAAGSPSGMQAYTIGLSTTETSSGQGDVEYAMYFDSNINGGGAVRVRILGVESDYALNYSDGDTFTFHVDGTDIHFQHNGVTFHSESGLTGTEDWYVDTSFYANTSGAYSGQADYSISNLRVEGNNGFVTSTPVDDLHISENANSGDTVGFVVPHDLDVSNDVVSDGLFLEETVTGSFTQFSSGGTFGDWSVDAGTINLLHDDATYDNSPLDGRSVELGVGASPATISQTLTTEIGKQYQVVFALSGDWNGGDDAKDLRVSAAGHSQDFVITESDGWSAPNQLWEHRTLKFTADSTTTNLAFESLETVFPQYGAVIGDVQVIEIPQAITTILNNDPTLDYDAATGKFYQFVNSTDDFNTSLAAANAASLNGIAGQLVTIRSQYENDLIRQFAIDSSNAIWLGATDANNDGNWNWLEGSIESSDQFWTGGAGGAASAGSYAPTFGQSESAGEEYARMNTDGGWADDTVGSNHAYVIEWDASEVLSNFTFSMMDASNNFNVDANTGEITVAATNTLDYETDTSHDVDVTVTDAAGNSYLGTMTITVDNEVDANQTVPGPQSVNEDEVLTFTSGGGNGVSVSDSLSGTDAPMQVTLSVNDGVLNLNPTALAGVSIVAGTQNSDTITFTGLESEINAALEGMTFTADADFNGSVTLNMTTTLMSVVDLDGHYTFEGGSADDQSIGTSQDGTLEGAATTVVDGTRGEVLSLDGDRDYVEITGTFGNPESVTLAAWINPNVGSAQEIISLGDNIALRVRSSGEVQAFYYDDNGGGGNFNGLFSGVNLTGGWAHVALTFDADNDTVTLYLDGLEVDSNSEFDAIDYSRGPNTTIGAHGFGETTWDFDGLIDDARIYTRALSATEISAIANDLAASGDQATVTDSVAITVTAVNDAPVVIGPGSAYSFTEQGSRDIHGTGFSVSDVDDGGGTMTATLTVGEGSLLLDAGDSAVTIVSGNSTDTVTISGTETELNALLSGTNTGTIVYHNDQTVASDTPSASTTITLTVNDQGSTGTDPGLTGDVSSEEGSASQTINITAVNDGPQLLGLELITNGDFSAGDLSGWATTGAASFDDGGLRFGSGNSVGPHTAAQVINTVAGQTYTLSFDYRDYRPSSDNRNQQLGVTVDGSANLLTTEPILSDTGDQAYVRYTFTFTADSATSTLSFTDNSDDVNAYSNSTVNTDNYLDNISVRQSGGGLNSVAFTEDATAVTLNSGIEVNDAELSDADDFEGATITLSRNGGAAPEDVFSSTGNLVLNAGTLELSLSSIGTYTQLNGELAITFDAGATAAQVNEALQSIAYRNTSDVPSASVLIDWTLNDGNSGSQGSGAALSTTGSTTVIITAINDNPTNAGSLPSDITVTEDVLSDVDLSAINLADLDHSGGDLTVTLSTSTGGDLTVSSGSGVTTSGSGTGIVTLTGTLTDLNTLLDTPANIQYLHGTTHINGNDADTVTVVVNDNGNTGTGGGTDQTLGTVNVDITAVNDEQVLATNAGATILEGSTGNPVSTAMLETTDVDHTATQLVYTVDSAPSNGVLYRNTVALNDADTFTQADVDAGLITYDHDGSETTSDGFDFSVDDGTGSTSSATFSLAVTPQNDAPVSTGNILVATEDTPTIIGPSSFSFTDAESDSLASVTITGLNLNGGTLTHSAGAVTVADGMTITAAELTDLTFTSALNDSTDSSFTYTVNDADAGVTTATMSITVNAANDVPVATGNTVTADEDIPLVIGPSDFNFSDIEGDALTSVTLTGLNLNGGTLTHSTGTVTVTDGMTVTAAELVDLTFTSAINDSTDSSFTYTVSDADTGGTSATMNITVNTVNDAPAITSTAGTAATEDTLYTYTATVTDPDDANNGTDLTWTLSGEPTGMVVSSTGVVTWTPAEGVTTSGAVTLTVSDGNEDGAVDATEAFTITVTPVNDAPTITSAAGTTATEDTLYTYTATVTDPDDTNNSTDLAWSLSGEPAGMVVSSTGVVTWTPTEGVTTSGTVTLTVSDGNEDGAVDAIEVFAVTVTPVNDAPTITSTAGNSATEDILYTYTATATDPDDANNGTNLTWSLSGEPAGMVVSSTGVVTWTPTEGVTTSGTVTLTVSDGNEDGAVDDTEVFVIAVTPVNDAPTITSTAGNSATEDVLYTYTATVSDPDDTNNGTDLTWSLSGEPAGMVVSSTGVVTWTPTEGVTTSGAVTLTVSDGNENGAVDATEVFIITVTPVNEAPTITSTAGNSATEDTLYTYTATVTDPDDANNGTDLTWSLSGAPAGMVVSSTGVVTWTPTEGVTTSGAVTLTVSDGNEDGAVDATEAFTITVTPVNDTPTITSTAGTAATEDVLYTYTATVTDPDDANNGTDLIWSLSGEPAGMVVSSTGVVTWTPTEGVTTSGEVTLTVSDGNEDGAVDATEAFTVAVTPVNDAPTITSTAGNSATEDILYTYTATATDPDDANNGTDLTWSLSGEPAGMVVSSTGVVTWTPTEGVTSSGAVTLTVSDGNEDGAVDATEVFIIAVTPVNDAPTITSTAGNSATEDTLYTYTATVTDPDDANNGTDLIWSLSGEPTGMVVSSTGLVTWTPTEGVTTSGSVTLTVSDGNEDGAVDDTEVFVIAVTAVNDVPVATGNTVVASEDVPLVISASDFNFSDVEGDALSSVTINVLNLNGGTLTHSAGAVTVTNGMTVSAAELADLTFTSAPNDSTNSSFTYTVNDADAGVTSAQMNITVSAVNDTPVATGNTVLASEDLPLVIDASDFIFTDVESDALVSVTLTDLNLNGGTLTHSAGAVTVTNGMTVTAAELADLTFASALNDSTDSSFSYTVNDADAGVVQAMMNITVNAANDVPVATGNTVVAAEDVPLVIDTGDFSFTDIENDALVSVTITGLNLNGGTLTHSAGATPVTNGMIITAAELADLTYTSALNDSTNSSFTYTVNDADAGVISAVMNITVNAVNDLPVATGNTVITTEDVPLIFSVGDFAFTDAELDSLVSITITGLAPVDGNLTHSAGTVSVAPGMTITAAELADLTYTSALNDSSNSGFSYTVNDADAGVVQAWMYITVNAANDLPVATGNTVIAAEDVPLVIDAGDFSFTDIESDSLTSVTLTGLNLNGGTLTHNAGATPVTNGMIITAAELADLTFTSALDDSTNSSFTYTVNDVDDGVTSAVMNITVNAVNDTPIITSTAGNSATEDTLYTYTATVTDPDDANTGTDLTWSLSGEPAGMVVSSTGVVTWTPTEGVTTSGAVTLTVSDGNEDGAADASEAFTITVTPVNDAPTITSTAGNSATEDTLYTYTATVTDPDDVNNGTDLTWSLSGAPTGMVVSSTGVVTWTPTEGVTTSGTVTLTVSDGNEDSAVDDTEIFTITVTPVNDAPVAIGNTVFASEDVPLVIGAGDFNFTDVEGDALASVTFTGLTLNGGTLTHSAGAVTVTNGMTVTAAQLADLTFTSASNDSTSSSFTYTVNDADNGITSGVMNITVNAVNDVPVATGNTVTADEDAPLIIGPSDFSFSDVESDGLTSVTITGLTLNGGTLTHSAGAVTVTNGMSITAAELADLTFTSALNDSSNSSFTYTVNDADSGITSGVMNITVNAVNDTPVATDNTVVASEDTALVFDPSDFTFSDLESDALTSVTVTGLNLNGGTLTHSAGTVTVSNGMTITAAELADLTFISALNDSTSSSFTYTVNDADAGVASATMNIAVNAVNDVPVATGSTVTADEDVPLVIGPSDFAYSDVEGDSLVSVTLTGLDLNGGTLTHSAGAVSVTDGMTINAAELADLTFTSALNDSTNSSFTYTVNDADNGITSGVMNITVNAVNDGPVATGQDVTAIEDIPRVIDAGYFLYTDIESDSLTSITVSNLQLNGGTLSHSAGAVSVSDGMTVTAAELIDLTFMPALHSNLPASFDYQVNDDDNGVNSATLNITILPINDAPAIITSNGGADAAAVYTVENNENVTTIYAIDADIGDGIAYGINGGADAGLFTIDRDSGELRFTLAPNFESAQDANRDNDYEVVVTASDGNGGLDQQTLTITVQDENESPEGLGLSNDLIDEDTDTVGGFIIGQLSATDEDLGDTLNFTLVGGADVALFSLTGDASGTLIIDNGIINYQQQPAYELVVRATDADGASVDRAFNITVTPREISTLPLIEAPEFLPAKPPLVEPPKETTEPTGQFEGTKPLEMHRPGKKPPYQQPSIDISLEAISVDEMVFLASELNPQNNQEAEFSTENESVHPLKHLDLSNLNLTPLGTFNIPTIGALSVADNEPFTEELERLSKDIESAFEEEEKQQQLITEIASGVTLSLTAGFISWTLQSGTLLASLLSAAPVWKKLDPLLILTASKRKSEEEPEETEEEKRIAEFFD